MPATAPRRLGMSSGPNDQWLHPHDRTLHNCPPSFWRRCAGCGRRVRAQDVRQGRHFRFAGRAVVQCGPVSQETETAGGTEARVRRLG